MSTEPLPALDPVTRRLLSAAQTDDAVPPPPSARSSIRRSRGFCRTSRRIGGWRWRTSRKSAAFPSCFRCSRTWINEPDTRQRRHPTDSPAGPTACTRRAAGRGCFPQRYDYLQRAEGADNECRIAVDRLSADMAKYGNGCTTLGASGLLGIAHPPPRIPRGGIQGEHQVRPRGCARAPTTGVQLPPRQNGWTGKVACGNLNGFSKRVMPSGPSGTRTQDLGIKSPLLYQLS